MTFSACSPSAARYQQPEIAPNDWPVMGHTIVSWDRFSEYFRSKNPNVNPQYLRQLFDIYLREGKQEGVDPVVAMAQMMHETGFLTFKGSVPASHYNYCGLGAVSSTSPGLKFPSPEIGVRAQIQHLKAYASTAPLRQENVDPRFQYVTRGSAPTVNALTGKWATDPQYGPKLMKHISELTKRDRSRF